MDLKSHPFCLFGGFCFETASAVKWGVVFCFNQWGGRRWVYHLQKYAGAGSKTFRKEVKYHFNIPSIQLVSPTLVCLFDKLSRPCCLSNRLKAFQEDLGVFIAGVYWDMTQRLSPPSPAPASQTVWRFTPVLLLCLPLFRRRRPEVSPPRGENLERARLKLLKLPGVFETLCFVCFSVGLWGDAADQLLVGRPLVQPELP